MDYATYIQIVFTLLGVLGVTLGSLFGIPGAIEFAHNFRGDYDVNVYRKIGENYTQIRHLRVAKKKTEFNYNSGSYMLNTNFATKFRGRIPVFEFEEDNALPLTVELLAAKEVKLKAKEEYKSINPGMLQRYLRNKVLATILQGSKFTAYTMAIFALGIGCAAIGAYLVYTIQTNQAAINALNAEINELLRQINAMGGH